MASPVKTVKGEARTLFEFADAIDRALVIRRYPRQSNTFICSFEHGETKNGARDRFLLNEHGAGRTARAAMRDYATKIQGKLLVFGAHTQQREQFLVPDRLVL